MENQNVKFSLIVLDACRNNPIKGAGRGKIKGLAAINAPAGSLVMYSTKAGDVASDGTGKNSPFTIAFLQHITTPGLDVNLLPSKVTSTVQDLTNGAQIPGSYIQITQSFTFVPAYTQKELDKIKKQQQSQLSELQIKEAELKLQKQKEDEELELKQKEIDKLEQQIEDMKNNTGGENDLDKMLEIIEQKEQQKEELDKMKRKAEAERKQREKEILEMKQKEFDENITKYNKIANSEFGQDMKETAWNSVLRNLGLSEGSIKVDDILALKIKFFDIPTQITDSRDGKTYKIVKIGNQVWMA
ncbi:MAG: caspase family protein, partial [Bacteroidota bacterium]|nr:caspase family protein [Bacteroidota bacterium]